MSQQPTLSIIICTCNRAASLQETIASMQGVEVPDGTQCELLIVDNASTDNTKEVVQSTALPQMSISYLYEPKRGQSNARNTGLFHAKGDIILWTDDDVRPSPQWIVKHLDCYLDSSVDAVLGAIEIDKDLIPAEVFDEALRFTANTQYGDAHIFPFTNHIIGANMSFRRRVYEGIGGFNPLLGPGQAGFYDDSDFSNRLMKAGFLQCYEPLAHVKHVPEVKRLSPKTLWNMAFRFGISNFIGDDFGAATSRPRRLLRFFRSSLRMLRWRMKQRSRADAAAFANEDFAYAAETGQVWACLQGKSRLMKKFGA